MAGEAGTALLVEISKTAIRPAVDATVRHVGYLINYKSNINNLKERAKDLETTRLDAENHWDSSANNNEEASHTSVAWLDKVKAAETAAYVIKEATEKQKTGCLNLKQRYLLSKNAVKKAEELMQLQIKGKGYASSTKPALPPSKSTGALANDGSKEFESRSKIMNEVMEALKDDKVSIIGVCGMGGVGKSTLMYELRERVKVNNFFHEVAMATVSQNADLSKIRCKLAEMLGLMGVEDKRNDIAVADMIHKRLTIKGRRVLVILDDIWNEINLEELGIPIGSERSNQTDCKVVLTSRQKGICSQMKAHTIIPVAVMPPKEAWYLFRKTAGDCAEIGDLKGIAEEVAGECGGLPIALVTLAKALSKQDIEIWKDAHFQLREHSVTRIPNMDKKVYSSIKMSFNFLARELPEAMPLLLLCCQHPEDDVICVESLVQYCFALRLLQNVDTLEGVRRIVCSLMAHLKSHFLLETVNDADGFDSDICVKMHDVIRDVGLKEESENVSMHTVKQSQDNVYKVGTSEPVHYPSLKILVQAGHSRLDESFFSQMKELRVLTYCQGRAFKTATVEGLTNLRMLYLLSVHLDEDTLSKIGWLTELELLSFARCRVDSFPRQIGQLHDLKLLDLRFEYKGSHSIPRGILPELKKLEELYLGEFVFTGDIGGSVEDTEVESQGNIAELKKLSNLKVLQIKLLNPLQLLGLLWCFEKLQRYDFGMVGEQGMFNTYERSLILREVSMEWILGDSIESIVKTAEQLRLIMIDGWTDPRMIGKFVSLQKLELRKCEHLEYLVSGNNSVFTKLKSLELKEMSVMVELCHNGNLPVGSLEKLRELYLRKLPKMRRLWVGPTDSLCLVNLTAVKITRCGALECIFPHSAAKCLVQLQWLTIEDCEMLTGIVSKGEGTATGRGGEIMEVPSDFKNPSDVITNNSHNVRGFCGMLKGIVSKGEGTATGRGAGGEMVEEPTDINILHFPKLRAVIIKKTPILRGFCCLDDDYVQPLLSPLVMLPSMVELNVGRLDQLTQIVGCGTTYIPMFTASDWLQNLEQIFVESCASLESLFDFEGMADNAHVVSLGKLQEIYMRELPSLTHIFRCRISDISIPLLQTINVYECHKLKNVVASNLIKLLQNLKGLHIEDLEILETVFDFEGLESMEDDARALLCELQELELIKLPKLEHVCRLAPKEIPVFINLTTLQVEDCGRLANLFSYSVARMLEKLKSLIVRNCKSMTEGVTMNEESDQKKIVFHSLCKITLVNLERLSSFCSSEQLEFEFPSLRETTIFRCPEMNAFCYGRLSTETLRGVDFDLWGGEREWKGDLNQTVQHYYASQMNRGLKENDIHVDKDGDDEDANNIVDDNYATAQQLNTRVNRMSSGLKQDGMGDNNAENSVDIYVPLESVHDEYIHCGNEVVVDPNVSKDDDGNADGDGPDGNAHCDTEGTPPELATKKFSPNASAQTPSPPSASAQDCADSSRAEVALTETNSMKTKTEKLLSDDSSSNSFVEFQEFKIIINDFIIDSELSSHVHAKYYELCCTRKCYLHQSLHKGINHKLAAEIISQIIDITDGIKASTLSTSLDKFASWDKTLEAFEILGTDVGFIRARLNRLVDIAKQYEIMFLQEANAAW